MKPEIWYDWDNNKNQSVFENNFYNLHAPDIKEDTTMDANMKKRNELLAKTVIKGLESRNMSGYYAQDKEGEIEIIITGEKKGAVGYAIYRMIDGQPVDLFGEGMEDCC